MPKRFTRSEIIKNVVKIKDNGKTLNSEEIVELLNNLHEENKKNKRIIQKQEISFANVVNAKYKCPYCQKEAFYVDFEEVME